MSRLATLVSLLVPTALGLSLGGCGSGIGVTDATGVGVPLTTESPQTTTGASASSGSSGPQPTTGGATGDEGSGTAGASTTDVPTTGPVTTSSTTSSSGPGSSSSGGSSTGGAPVGACVDVSGDYGACEAELGYGFDGTTCRLFSGCDCAPNCDNFAPDPVGCADACAAAGECNEAAIASAALAMDPVGVDSFCDEVDACVPAGSELATWTLALFPEAVCEPGFPCDGTQSCHLQFQGTIDAAQWTRLCAASLLPGAELYCVVFGP